MLAPLNLSDIIEVSQGSPPVAAGVSLITGATIDMQGYENCLIIAKFGVFVATATMNLKAQGGAASNGSDAADYTTGTNGGATGVLTASGTAFDLKTAYLDVIRPTKRYLTAVIVRAVANCTLESLLYVRYGSRKCPTAEAALIAGGGKVITF